jgi:hypothetical protein
VGKPARSGQLVLVEWRDAHADSGWAALGDVKTKPDIVMSVGWVIHHDDKAITVCADRGRKHRRQFKKTGDVNRTLTIPAGMIRKVWEIHI